MASIQILDEGKTVDQEISVGSEGVPAVGDTVSVLDFENVNIVAQYKVLSRQFMYDTSGELAQVSLSCSNRKNTPFPFGPAQ
jgi:hypothetical protein